MSQAVSHQPGGSLDLPMLFEPIKSELVKVEDILARELHSEHGFVDELVKHGCLMRGKRLRPALLLLAGKAAGETGHDHCTLAAVVEMIHTATLIHDDVLDEAEVRRHLSTVNAIWSNESSVLLGDYLFTHAFHLASTLDSTFACRLIGKTTNLVCEGELRQIASRGNFQLTEQEYLEIIEAKTAELCACCCQLGAHYADVSPRLAENLREYGRNLGIAFQIVDDVLDLLGEEETVGKSLGTDLDKQKPTLPLICLLERASVAERSQLVELLRGQRDLRSELLPWLKRFEAFEYAYGKARHYARRAQENLSELAASPARDVLMLLSEFVVNRAK